MMSSPMTSANKCCKTTATAYTALDFNLVNGDCKYVQRDEDNLGTNITHIMVALSV